MFDKIGFRNSNFFIMVTRSYGRFVMLLFFRFILVITKRVRFMEVGIVRRFLKLVLNLGVLIIWWKRRRVRMYLGGRIDLISD